MRALKARIKRKVKRLKNRYPASGLPPIEKRNSPTLALLQHRLALGVLVDAAKQARLVTGLVLLVKVDGLKRNVIAKVQRLLARLLRCVRLNGLIQRHLGLSLLSDIDNLLGSFGLRRFRGNVFKGSRLDIFNGLGSIKVAKKVTFDSWSVAVEVFNQVFIIEGRLGLSKRVLNHIGVVGFFNRLRDRLNLGFRFSLLHLRLGLGFFNRFGLGLFRRLGLGLLDI